jgi:hypothetical protein
MIQQIDQMEVFAMLFAKADIQLKLKELQREEEQTGEKVLLGPPQIKLESFSRDDGDLDWMLERARALKGQFEVEILAALGRASSHRELWQELHPPTSPPGNSSSENDEFVILANLKGKTRAREKITLEYAGDTRKLKDMLRGSILCRDMSEINTVWKELERLEGQGVLQVVVLKNRFRGAPFPGGYRDMNVAVVFQGFVCEIQIHSIEHYRLKKNQHPVYCLCRSYGLVGELEDAPKGEAGLSLQPEGGDRCHATSLPTILFILRLLAAIWAYMEFFFYIWAGVCHQYAYKAYMADIGPVKPWKAAVLAAPYLLVGGMLTADGGPLGICLALVFSIGWGYVVVAEGYVPVDINATVEDYEVPLVASTFPMLVCVALYFYVRRKTRRPGQASRVSVLYARYFGMKGSLFAWKVGALQCATVAMQSYTKLAQLGRFASGEKSDGFLIFKDLASSTYWYFFGLLVFNAVFPNLLLMSDNLFLQRVVVSFLDVAMDLLYLLVVPVVLFATHETDHMFVPTDFIGFLSNLTPALHVMTGDRHHHHR